MIFAVSMLLAALVAVPTRAAWQPCGAIPPTHCQSHDFSSLVGTAALEVGLPTAAAGAWRVADSTLFEESRTHNGTGADYDAACVRELGAVRYIDPPFPLSDLFEARVKVRITADGGGLAGFLFSDKTQGTYYRWQLNSQPACNESALVFRTADVNMVPSDLSNTIATQWVAARRNEWYELRIYVSYVDSGTGGGFSLFSIEQSPTSIPSSLGNEVAGTSPTMSGGTKLGLWCSTRGTTGGCEFRDFVIVAKSLRDKLVGPLDCNACNLQLPAGSTNWCRCCDQECGQYTRASCIANNFCASQCLTAKSCNGTTLATQLTQSTAMSPTSPGATTTAAGPSGTAATTSTAPGATTTTTIASSSSADGSTTAKPGDSVTSGGSTTSVPSTTTSSAGVISLAATALLLISAINFQ